MLKNYFFVFLVLLSSISQMNAQIPDKFSNLRVLPKDISKEELIKIMKSFTFSLGVRCNHCHEGDEGKSLNTFNFESDIKTEKLKAREMIKMTRAINNNYLSKLSNFESDKLQVTCLTCHHTTKQPQTLENLIINKIKSVGLVDAISIYDSLYERYFGGFAYDFNDYTLVTLSQMLSNEQLYDEAITFSKINVDKYPDSGIAWFGLSEAYELKGDNGNAMICYKKTLKLMPQGEEYLNKKLRELTEH